MCRIIFGCLNSAGDIISGSNGDDPALDFNVEKIGDDGLEVHYTTPFTAKPSLTLTANYGGEAFGGGTQLGNLVLTLNEPNRFRLRLPLGSNASKPVDFSFIALK